MRTCWVRILLVSLAVLAQGQTVEPGPVYSVLAPKNELALTPENLCLGFKNVFAITKQSFQEEVNLLCPNMAPSPLLLSLIAAPYQGVGDPVLTTIANVENADNTTLLTVAYAIRVPKSPAQTLIGEEKHVPVPYSLEPLTVTTRFMDPAPNEGDADTVFTVEQRTVVDAGEEFDDLSVHDLKLYRMHPNNFDFLAAVRTLRTPSDQFKKAVVVRGVMKDPNDPNSSISVSVLNFLMNSRDEADNVAEVFSQFIVDDTRVLYTELIK
ncbi:hypothetical protein [Oligoflexus tunisiensis]|uniref:hypothetical protein n=1 Tax=Oligoflexus tunisiensis TaxID=708132 RepID=UPI00114CDDC0|nr:hypothetical protein [Oligoflexus tunisiensis]